MRSTVSVKYKKKYSEKLRVFFSIDHKIKSQIHIIDIIASLQRLLLQLHRTVHNSKILKTQMFSLSYVHVLYYCCCCHYYNIVVLFAKNVIVVTYKKCNYYILCNHFIFFYSNFFHFKKFFFNFFYNMDYFKKIPRYKFRNKLTLVTIQYIDVRTGTGTVRNCV